ncbi:MAG: beta-N-acetylhexosaminidase, partial [Bacteroidaceae bacterium]|nr:beta-N-acetylhexosaminidase [Bacteroidaceae bacterium]
DETLGKDAYTLVVNEPTNSQTQACITIKASEFGGWFYALQTLKQLLPRAYFDSTTNANADWTLPYVSISDSPHLGHRGYMLDIARHFFNKEEVKKVLDIMALYKMNRFHWHLTDDQGWRIEIPEYPKLTEVGAIRSASFSNPGDGQTFYDDTEYGRGMWYSQEDLKEVVAYATARNIEIMPEVDLPGHMVAAVTSYPEFSCDSTKHYEVRVNGGISHDVLNIGDDRVIDFLKCVMDNLAKIFPHQYIHFGGDECPTEQWAKNDKCLQRVADLGLDGVHQLQSWLVEELGTYVKEKYNKDIVVWDELLAHWNDDNKVKPVIMAWNNVNFSAKAADRGMKSIIVPYQVLYLDFLQAYVKDRFVDELYNGGWGDGDNFVNTVDEIYNFNPLSSLSGREDFALGVQGNMWTETTNDIDEVEYQLLPRLLALSEIGWLPTAKKDWGAFYKRLQSQDEIFDALDYKYGKHFFEPTVYTEAQQTLRDAADILKNSIRGSVGYPEAGVYDALSAALAAANETDEASIETLQTALTAYKDAPIVQPQPGKMYQLVSASTYYKRQYEGATMYQKNNAVRFHYTPQTEPEELWQFTTTDAGAFVMTNVYSGKQLWMGNYNTPITMTEAGGTPVRIDKATVATGNYTYIPGVVTISAVDDYSAVMTGSAKRLSAEGSGEVYAKDEAALCYNGTWKIVEVTDFTAQLAGLVKKCEIIVLKANPGEMNDYTAEAIDFLTVNVINPAKDALAAGSVTEAVYKEYMALYQQFQDMERTSIVQGLSETHYYYLRNVWFGKYAAVNISKMLVVPADKENSDRFLWRIVKKPGGKVVLYNKATDTAAYPEAYDGEQGVKMGNEYHWILEERTLDGKSGICIIDNAEAGSWYTNPNSWNYILMKPFWGACTWEFEKSGVEIPTSIQGIQSSTTGEAIYDLTGRKVVNIHHPGVYIKEGQKVLVK